MELEKSILDFLHAHHIEFEYLEHEPTPTCELSAKARGIEQRLGGKTLLFKDKASFKIFTLSSALEADSKKVRHILKSQKLRFATADELQELAGVQKGALPPFGRPILDFDHYIDESIYQNDILAFNPGILTKSVIMKVEDYLRLVPNSVRVNFAKD